MITIARVSEGPQKHEYLFSPGTVSRAVDYFKSVRDQPYRTDGPAVSEGLYDDFLSAPGHPFVAKIIEPLSTSFHRARIFGMAAWKWPGVLLAIVVAVALFVISCRFQWKLTMIKSPTVMSKTFQIENTLEEKRRSTFRWIRPVKKLRKPFR